MRIAVAGPYSAPTEAERRQNLDNLNKAAALLLLAGHIPVIGVNAALPVVAQLPPGTDTYKAIMDISMATISACESILIIKESPGANRERDYFVARGLPVYHTPGEIPPVA